MRVEKKAGDCVVARHPAKSREVRGLPAAPGKDWQGNVACLRMATIREGFLGCTCQTFYGMRHCSAPKSFSNVKAAAVQSSSFHDVRPADFMDLLPASCPAATASRYVACLFIHATFDDGVAGYRSGRSSWRGMPVARSIGMTHSAGTYSRSSHFEMWPCVFPMRVARAVCPPARSIALRSALMLMSRNKTYVFSGVKTFVLMRRDTLP